MRESFQKPKSPGLKLPEGVKLNRGSREDALEKYPGPHLACEGQLEVLKNFFERKEDTINVVVYLGGGDRPQGGGVSLAFQEHGLVPSIDYIYGSSTGIATASHAVTGEAEKNKRMYRMLTAEGPFKKSFVGVPLALRGDVVREVAEGRLGSMKIAREKESGGPELVAVVTDRESGDLEFLEAKRHFQAMDVRFASANAPTPNQLAGVEVEGRMKTDGMLANTFPIKEIISDVRARIDASNQTRSYKLSVCAIMNTEEAKAKYGESIVMKAYMSATHPKQIADKVWSSQKVFNDELSWVREQIQVSDEGKSNDQFLLVWSVHHPALLQINQAESKVLFEGAQHDFSRILDEAKAG
jgi:predicted patatin/cPLA2 family phospholipase